MKPLDVGIIGAGTAGCAAATLLARSGHRVTLFERVEAPSPVGAGILLQPTGLAALARIGALEAVVSRGALVRQLRCVTARGRALLDLTYGDLGASAFGVGMHRGVLFEALFATAKAAGATIRTGVEVTGIGSDISAHRELRGADGSLGVFDLVLVADGARSHLRDGVEGLRAKVQPYAWGAVWTVGEDAVGGASERLYQVVDGTRRLVGLLPTGIGPSGSSGKALASLFWSLRGADFEAFRARGLDSWRDECAQLMPESRTVLEAIPDVEALTWAPYFHVTMRRWHAPGVVVLGDAAHAMSPQLGQGANLALMDAVALADCVDGGRPISDYTRERGAHLRYYQRATRWLTPFFQSEIPGAGVLRDLALPLVNAVPWTRREMVRTMGGLKEGFLVGRRSLPSMPPALLLPEVTRRTGGG